MNDERRKEALQKELRRWINTNIAASENALRAAEKLHRIKTKALDALPRDLPAIPKRIEGNAPRADLSISFLLSTDARLKVARLMESLPPVALNIYQRENNGYLIAPPVRVKEREVGRLRSNGRPIAPFIMRSRLLPGEITEGEEPYNAATSWHWWTRAGVDLHIAAHTGLASGIEAEGFGWAVKAPRLAGSFNTRRRATAHVAYDTYWTQVRTTFEEAALECEGVA